MDIHLKEFADDLVGRFDIRAPSPYIPVRYLSGGNIQKLILARVISGCPALLIASCLTRGD